VRPVVGNVTGPEPAEVRQERISALVEEQGFVRVSDLSARFGVSTVTVRTDLQSLESHGRVRPVQVAEPAR
jgi:DeoR/GlpR family transcriptional regulator of sugar metabolism